MTTTTVDPATGEITETTAAKIIPADDASRYAALCDEISALELRMRERLDVLDRSDPVLMKLAARHQDALIERGGIGARWHTAFEHVPPGTKLDSGRVLVSKPKPRTTWRQHVTARDLVESDARDSLVKIVEATLEQGYTPERMADAIIAWLGPEAVEGKPGDLRITVRPPEVRS